jgi:hypothetical protein
VSYEIGESVVGILQQPSGQRSKAQIDLIQSLFESLPFMQTFRSKLLQQHCCRYLRAVRLLPGQLLYSQGEVGEEMFIVVSGSMTVQKWRGNDNKRPAAKRRGENSRCSIGTAFGEQCLTSKSEFGRRRGNSVRALETTVLAVLSRHHYATLKKAGQLEPLMDLHWEMCMNHHFRTENCFADKCDYKLYRAYNLCLSKTLHSEWSYEEADEQVGKDWARDIGRHNLGHHHLTQRQFGDALFELVDTWCEGLQLSMYGEFLTKLYENIRCFWKATEDDKNLYVLLDFSDVKNAYVELQQLRSGQKQQSSADLAAANRLAGRMRAVDAAYEAGAGPSGSQFRLLQHNSAQNLDVSQHSAVHMALGTLHISQKHCGWLCRRPTARV